MNGPYGPLGWAKPAPVTIEDFQSTLLEDVVSRRSGVRGMCHVSRCQILGLTDQKLAITRVRKGIGAAKCRMLSSQQIFASCPYVPISAFAPRETAKSRHPRN